MAVKFSNNAVTTLSASISSGATSFSVASASLFPTLSGVDWTYITIDGEVIKITAISGTTFTCDATSTSHSSGVNVELRMTAELLNDFAEDSDIYTHPTGEGDKHIPTGGATDQYLKYTSSGTAVWSTVTAGVNLTSATTAPASPSTGDQWFDTANGILFAYMTDGTDSQWIDISSSNGQAAAAAAGGGAMEFVSKTTVSSGTASVSFTGLTSGFTYKLIFTGLDRSANAFLYARFIDGNGADIATSEYGTKLVQNGNIVFTGNQETKGRLDYATNDLVSGNTTIQLDSGGSLGSLLTATVRMHQATPGWSTEESTSGVYLAATSAPTGGISGVKLYPSSGNFDAGIITFYKIKDS
jgi:hypothetical protein